MDSFVVLAGRRSFLQLCQRIRATLTAEEVSALERWASERAGRPTHLR